MSRKAFAAIIVLLLAGLTPATAIIGFCARMPCCSHPPAPIHVTTDPGDCCTTVTCYDVPSAKLNAQSAVVYVAARAFIVGPAIAPVTPPITLPLPDPSPPPPVTARLAILSILIV